jgi:hypothetical protein
MFTIIEKNFASKYKILNYSNKPMNSIPIIINICHKNPEYIIYLERNENNLEYFNFIDKEKSESQFYDPTVIKHIVLNKDNYVIFRDYQINEKTIIRHIQKNLLNEESCPICSNEKTIKDGFNCNNCNTYICNTCLNLLFKNTVETKPKNIINSTTVQTECPYCRNNFTCQFIET